CQPPPGCLRTAVALALPVLDLPVVEVPVFSDALFPKSGFAARALDSCESKDESSTIVLCTVNPLADAISGVEPSAESSSPADPPVPPGVAGTTSRWLRQCRPTSIELPWKS